MVLVMACSLPGCDQLVEQIYEPKQYDSGFIPKIDPIAVKLLARSWLESRPGSP
jgi:hypothetical protein